MHGISMIYNVGKHITSHNDFNIRIHYLHELNLNENL